LGRSLRHLYFPQGVMVSLRILTSLMLGWNWPIKNLTFKLDFLIEH
jgi:hypothetical protein